MTVQMVRPRTIDFPAPTPLKGTLLDVAGVSDGIAWLDLEGMVESYNCLQLTNATVWPCPRPDPIVPKVFVPPTWQDGFHFAVYGGIMCKNPGFGDDNYVEGKARAAFEAMEAMGVERALMNTRFRALGGSWAAPTDLTPAAVTNAPVGLAILEGDAACNYAGSPIIHMPREIASILTANGQIEFVGNQLVTKLGSRVAAGGGYGCPNTGPTGAEPPPGEFWMYATGDVHLARGELMVHAELDRTTNETSVLAERAYVAAVDCYVAAVRVELYP